MSYRADKQVIDTHTDTHTHRHTDATDDNTRRPKLASGKNVPFLSRTLTSGDEFSADTAEFLPEACEWLRMGDPKGLLIKIRVCEGSIPSLVETKSHENNVPYSI